MSASDLPGDWFSVSRPENTASDTSAQSLTALPLGAQRDRASGRAYAPLSLGRGFALGAQPMCFLGAQAVQTYDQTSPSRFDALDAELAPDPYGPLSWVDVDYGAPQGGRCTLGDAHTPVRLSLRSMRSDSEMGRAYRAAYT